MDLTLLVYRSPFHPRWFCRPCLNM
jgi:hypothetical protein